MSLVATSLKAALPLIAAILFFTPANGYKILVTATGLSTSHNLIMYRLADLIGSHGNDVTVLQWTLNPKAKATKLQHAKEITYPLIKDETVIESMTAHLNQMPWQKRSIFKVDLSVIQLLRNILTQGCASFLNDTTHPVHQHLFTEKYDVVVIHAMDMCTFGITEMIKNPSRIHMTPMFMPDSMAYYAGVPSPPSYVPATMSAVFRQKAGPDFPAVTDLFRETQLYFINADPFFEYPRPIQHNIIYVGGLTMQQPEPLDDHWQKVMNESSENGVVIFSMGSVASTKDMPMEMKNAIINAFSHFPQYTFLVRMEGELPKLSDNIQIVDWIPQKDLLAHPKIRAFFTHGGYNSLTEATYTGVPLVVMPLFGDQIANVKRIERSGVGVAVDKEDLTEQSVVDALTKVLEDESYNAKAKRLSKMMKEKPTSSADLAIGWVEYLAKFRTVENLLPESRHMGFIQYHSLDRSTILYLSLPLRNLIKMLQRKLLTVVLIACFLYASFYVADAEPTEHSASAKLFRAKLISRLRRQFPQLTHRKNRGDSSQVGGLSGRGDDEWGKDWGGRIDKGGRRDDINTDDGRGGAVGRVRQT
uniref:glucuronosyltransferase n=1 Tax=Plectus sambesii TaxID=2011161 RepID=A0A914XF58_9BILA